MNYKILEQNGIENENVDGAAFNNFSAGGKSGVIKGVLNECNITFVANTLTIDKGLLLINGVRIKIVEPYDFSLTGIPAVETNYQILARVQMLADRTVSFEFVLRTPQAIVKDSFFKTESGVYELEIAEFIHGTDGSIKNVQRKYEIISGSSSGGTGSSVEVVQSTGTSETAVMSQKATTEELDKKIAKTGGTIEGELFLKNGGEDNKYGAISSISADGSTTYLLRPYKNGDELHEVIGNSSVIPEILAKKRPIVRIGDDYDYMATKGDVDNLTADDLGAMTDVQLNGTSITENGVANIPFASPGRLGVVQEHPSGGVYSGIAIDRNTGTIKLTEASSDAFFNNPQYYSVAVTANKLYRWIKVGLVQNDQTLTDEEKTKIQGWLGITDLIQKLKEDNNLI